MTDPLQLTLLHVVGGEHMGYGRVGVYLARELRKKHHVVYDQIAESPRDTLLSLSHQHIEFTGERTPGLTNVLCWCSVPSHARGWWDGQIPMIFTMWEATELPAPFRENLHEFETVIVPSQQNVELFGEYHDNVKYVPLGVDPQRWGYSERRTPGARFNFFIGGSGERKGTDLAVRAFRKCFPEGSWPSDMPVPYLVMKQPKPESFYGARIERVTGRLSAEAEVDLYREMHCYLQPSRGEGWGLQPLQAIAQGMPTILTDAHGHAAFAHLGMGIGSKLVPAGYFLYGPAGDWWEPDFDELCDSMLWTYYNYEEACQRAKVNAQIALEEFTWEKAADRFLDAVGRERCGPYVGNRQWRTTTPKLFRVITKTAWKADIGGTLYTTEAGEENWWPADVKRILFEGGHLDGDCITDRDHGLHPEQVKRIPGYLDRENYCPTCYQRKGSGVTMADEILAGEREGAPL